jgi:cytochrome c oxidase cbb3-type subunit 3
MEHDNSARFLIVVLILTGVVLIWGLSGVPSGTSPQQRAAGPPAAPAAAPAKAQAVNAADAGAALAGLTGDAAAGEQLFVANCAACHQTDGTGKIGLAPSVRNRDFLALASDGFIAATIRGGRPNTAMVARPDLSDQALADIIAFLRALPIANSVAITVDPSRSYHGDAAAGREGYATYCASCHGARGEGYSAGGSGPGIGLPGFLNVASEDFIFQTLKHGRLGTPMRAFIGADGLANLTEQEAADIIAALPTLAGEQQSAAAPTVTGDAAAGEKHFIANCSACHQADGTGKIGLAPSIRNRDFLALASDSFIDATIRGGRPGTAMVARPDLSEQVVADIIAWMRALPVANAVSVSVDPNREFNGNAAAGRHAYAAYCASCHGSRGEGYAAGGSGPGIGLPGFLNVASDDFIYQTLRHGRVGTPMRAFIGDEGLANLTEEDAADIIAALPTLALAAGKPDDTPAGPPDVVAGEKLFLTNCAACHQTDGTGKIGLAPSIRNRDFLALASDAFIATSIRGGRPGTAMVPRPDLSNQAIADIIGWLRALPVANPTVVTVDPARKYHGDAAAGRVGYARYCASCHGGRGEGYSAGGSGPGIGLPGFLSAASEDFVFQTLRHGRVGTPMRPFIGNEGLANLTEQEAADIIAALPTLASAPAPEPPPVPGDTVAGQKHFLANCAACHQADGTGKIGLAPSVRNRDFLALASDSFIRDTIRNGRPGTAMIPRPDLSEQVVSDIITWLRALDVANPISVQVDPHLTLSGDAAAGAPLFAAHCAPCHGASGEGYAAGGSGPGIGTAGFLSAASDDYILQTLRLGRVGTPMRPFIGNEGLSNLTEDDAADIIAFLRSLN